MSHLKTSLFFIYTLQHWESIRMRTENKSVNLTYLLLLRSALLEFVPCVFSLNMTFLSSFHTNLSMDKSVMLQVTPLFIPFSFMPFVVCRYCTTQQTHHYSNNHGRLVIFPYFYYYFTNTSRKCFSEYEYSQNVSWHISWVLKWLGTSWAIHHTFNTNLLYFKAITNNEKWIWVVTHCSTTHFLYHKAFGNILLQVCFDTYCLFVVHFPHLEVVKSFCSAT